MVSHKQSSAGKKGKLNAVIKARKKPKKADKSSHMHNEKDGVQWQTTDVQAKWFNAFLQSMSYSSLSELEATPPLSEETFVSMEQEGEDREIQNLHKHVKNMFKGTWAKFLCESGRDREKGSPMLLILCSSATRCVDILKGLMSFTKTCKPAKLFAKHIKVEEQVKALEDCVNIAVGTPNRVKKLIDIGALGLGSLKVVIFDMQKDAKGFTIFTIPQVKEDLLELCKSHLHECFLHQQSKICLY
ncbi:hypothetical protein KP509_19G030700 [Ceratopteris richardii]|uniref:Protein CMSS1 n=2 Tax=Ceratopteris richardii TaxID=49495 RepID=A0A8T2SKZ2_CERRI|nr:hypothetical protein KP509_19G030700 [Ceratopteris richardii]